MDGPDEVKGKLCIVELAAQRLRGALLQESLLEQIMSCCVALLTDLQDGWAALGLAAAVDQGLTHFVQRHATMHSPRVDAA
eukprot:1642371-Amphidinium_carterae.1